MTEGDANPGGTPVEQALDGKCSDADSASYERTVRTAVEDFVDRSSATIVEEIEVQTVRRYARALDDDDELADSTVRKYFRTTRAWLGWCVREQIIEQNPALTSDAEEPLPETDSSGEQQFWEPRDRKYLLNGLDALLDHALDGSLEEDADPLLAQRDQVLCWMLGYTAVRGAEILRDPDEDHHLRQGLRWEQLSLDEGTMVVLGKTRDQEPATIPSPVVDRLRRWHQRLDPASGEWPVFPTLSIGPLHRRDTGVLDELEAVGYEKGSEKHPIDACREHGVTPPAMTVEAGRNRLRHYSGLWGLPTDAEDEDAYMEPHGGRRALGGELYEQKPTMAQDQLRHNSIETTNMAYRDKQAAERQDDLDEALGFGED